VLTTCVEQCPNECNYGMVNAFFFGSTDEVRVVS
jgi:hypothetical protein